MRIQSGKLLFFLIAVFFLPFANQAQNTFLISGKVVDAATKQPLPHATVHLFGHAGSTLSKDDGSFRIRTETWYDTLEISTVGHELSKVLLQKEHTGNLVFELKMVADSLQTVTVTVAKKPGKTFMEKVIEYKPYNNPERFQNYSYERYTRNELDLDNIDYRKINKKAMKGLMASIYAGFDSSSKYDKELPIYFSEVLVNNYHAVSPNVDKESILAKKSLGLKTDDLLRHLEKFYFSFNVYDNWIAVFDQTYVSPLNTNAFSYYNFYAGDTLVENGNTIRQIRFVPVRSYERAFTGTLWINDSSYAVENVNMHLTKTANLNFVKDINYSEEYKEVYDSLSDKMAYMPFRFSSEVKFEAGLALLGIPVPESKESLQLSTKSTSVLDKVIINTNEPSLVISDLGNKEKLSNYEKPDSYWATHRLDSLSKHEKSIYLMVDSLLENRRFQRNIKVMAFAGTGYWDFGKQIRLGPYSSFISKNPNEGWRFRIGFWTMPGISKHLNFYGYGAYGMKDKKIKGGLGLKYVWNETKWTKTSVWFGGDYDYVTDQYDELDKDNIINSFLRKSVPYTRTYIKQAILKHEQYLNCNFSAKASIGYKELNPVFDFSYNPINPQLEKPIDSISLKILPVAEVSVGLRYAHKERTTILNYDQLQLGTFSPVFSVSYTHGFELSKTHFDYDKINIGISQQLRLPPKSILYYSLNAGRVFGTIPYLLLNIPAGNEYYVSSKYEFNTMTPYEFAADRYIGLHTRLSLGGVLLDKIPFVQKLGWRERISCNMYWGDMTRENIDYNKKSNFNLVGNQPFMEAGIGIDNIFHILSIEYFRRFTQLSNPYAKKEGLYLGLHLLF